MSKLGLVQQTFYCHPNKIFQICSQLLFFFYFLISILFLFSNMTLNYLLFQLFIFSNIFIFNKFLHFTIIYYAVLTKYEYLIEYCLFQINTTFISVFYVFRMSRSSLLRMNISLLDVFILIIIDINILKMNYVHNYSLC
jgi:hypothetical protein